MPTTIAPTSSLHRTALAERVDLDHLPRRLREVVESSGNGWHAAARRDRDAVQARLDDALGRLKAATIAAHVSAPADAGRGRWRAIAAEIVDLRSELDLAQQEVGASEPLAVARLLLDEARADLAARLSAEREAAIESAIERAGTATAAAVARARAESQFSPGFEFVRSREALDGLERVLEIETRRRPAR